MNSNKLFTVAEAAPLIATVTKEHPLDVAKRISSQVSSKRGAITIFNYAGWPLEEENWPYPHDLFRFSSKVKDQPYHFFHEMPYTGYRFNLIELLNFLGLDTASKEEVLKIAFNPDSEDTSQTASLTEIQKSVASTNPTLHTPHPAAGKQQNNKRWTPELLAEAAEFRAKHGTKNTALHYGVSTSLIRQKLPKKKPSTKWFPTLNNH